MATTSTLDKPNIAPKDKSGNEKNPPKAQKNGVNSSSTAQKDGPSTPKSAQGVLRDTLTEWNNAIPTAGCPIKLPSLYNKLQTKLKLLPEVEANRLKEWAKKLGEFMAPLVEAIDQAISAIKTMIKEITDFIKEMTDLFKEIQEWIQLTMEFVQFVMSLPARLAQLIQNCLQALMDGVSNYVSDKFNDIKTGFEEGLSNTSIPFNATTGNYTQLPPVIKK
jgi:hypothetical protein